MNDADREIVVERLRALVPVIDSADISCNSYWIGEAADLIEVQAKRIEELEQDDDCGGGVSGCQNMRRMCRSCQLMAKDAELIHLWDWQRRAVSWLPKCGTACQCQGEPDCELKLLRREAAQAAAAKGASDA